MSTPTAVKFRRMPGVRRAFERIGFAGRIFPVNPNHTSVLNRRCYASPAALPEAPDIASSASATSASSPRSKPSSA